MNPQVSHSLLAALAKVEQKARCTRLQRMLYNPYKYVVAMTHRELIYPKHKQEKLVTTGLFFDNKMKIALPAAIDIYLTGGKTHSSELRLAKYLIKQLESKAAFLDIGAHFGYYTMLAATLVGEAGRVFSFEPTNKSFDLLLSNTAAMPQVTLCQCAVSNNENSMDFYEFQTLYSEYNSSDITQYKDEVWFQKSTPTKITIPSTTIDIMTATHSFFPVMIKIDVEGAEDKVISGGLRYFETHSPIIIMEYVEPKRNNVPHHTACTLLKKSGYSSFSINEDATLSALLDIDTYLQLHQLESDNIVFKKK